MNTPNLIDPGGAKAKLEALEDLISRPGWKIFEQVMDQHLTALLVDICKSADPNMLLRMTGQVSMVRELKNWTPQTIAALKMQLAPQQKKEK